MINAKPTCTTVVLLGTASVQPVQLVRPVVAVLLALGLPQTEIEFQPENLRLEVDVPPGVASPVWFVSERDARRWWCAPARCYKTGRTHPGVIVGWRPASVISRSRCRTFLVSQRHLHPTFSG